MDSKINCGIGQVISSTNFWCIICLDLQLFKIDWCMQTDGKNGVPLKTDAKKALKTEYEFP